MRLQKIIALMAGLVAFAAVVILAILMANSRSPIFGVLIGIAAILLTPVGFELCRYSLSASDKGYRFFSPGVRGWFFDLAHMSLALCLTVVGVIYQQPSGLFCRGLLGAGFPAPFICDASGESPLSSVGKIDWADVDSLTPLGSFLDILFYLALLSIAWVVIRGVVRSRIRSR